jgi:Uma2 family endonuclease
VSRSPSLYLGASRSPDGGRGAEALHVSATAAPVAGGSSSNPSSTWAKNVVVPDLAGWRRETLPALPDEASFTLEPDWACEVLSPGTSRTDRTKKLPIYARARIPHLWLVDPLAETLEAYELQNERWSLLGTHGGDDVVQARPFEAVAMELKRLWGRS